ncbi:MAG: nitroreductase family protein [Bacteroidales bacterium]
MELYEGLLTRRSIRKYTGEKINDRDIDLIIKAGMYAPSANNKRPWHFVIIDDREVMDRIMTAHPYASMLKDASHAIVVCGDLKKQNAPGYYLLDCSAATQNVLLAAHALGYGAVWLGVEPREGRIRAISEILKLPEDIRPVSVVSVGVPAEKPHALPERYEPGKIRKNRW